MEFSLFKEVILGDVSSIIFGYSRLFTRQYLRCVIENSDCDHYNPYPTESPFDFIGQHRIGISYSKRNYGSNDLHPESFFSSEQYIVLVPFNEDGYPCSGMFEFCKYSKTREKYAHE